MFETGEGSGSCRPNDHWRRKKGRGSREHRKVRFAPTDCAKGMPDSAGPSSCAVHSPTNSPPSLASPYGCVHAREDLNVDGGGTDAEQGHPTGAHGSTRPYGFDFEDDSDNDPWYDSTSLVPLKSSNETLHRDGTIEEGLRNAFDPPGQATSAIAIAKNRRASSAALPLSSGGPSRDQTCNYPPYGASPGAESKWTSGSIHGSQRSVLLPMVSLHQYY